MTGSRAWRHWPDSVAAEIVAAIGCHNSKRTATPLIRMTLRARVQLHLARARHFRRIAPCIT